MTRDFEIIFSDDNSLKNAYEILSSIKDIKNIKVFNHIEIRPLSLFCTLTYPYEIKRNQNFYKRKEITDV